MGSEKRVLITGASGLLGRALMNAFTDASWSILGLAYSRAKGNLVRVDITNTLELENTINEFQPRYVIHAAAQRFPDKCENDFEKSFQLNVQTSKALAEITVKKGIPLLFISTDYVFDGKKPPYTEEDPPSPVNKYGQTKAEAERAILKANPDSIILRIPVLYGYEEYLGESSVSSLLKTLLDTTQTHKVSVYEIRYPSHTDDVAVIVLKLLEQKIKEPKETVGIFQWCGSEGLTKFGMVKLMSQGFGLSMDHIKPEAIQSGNTQRPHNTQLSTERLTSLGIGQHTNFQEGIHSFRKFLQ